MPLTKQILRRPVSDLDEPSTFQISETDLRVQFMSGKAYLCCELNIELSNWIYNV